MLGNSSNNSTDCTPLPAKSIENDIYAAKIHLNNYVTIEVKPLPQIGTVYTVRFILKNKIKNKYYIISFLISISL